MPKPKPKKIWREFWRFISPFHKRAYIMLALVFVIEAVALIGPYLTKLIIDKLSNFQTADLKDILWLILVFLIAEQGAALINFMRDRQLFRFLFDIEYYLPTRSQEKLIYLPLSYHEKENTGNKIAKIDRGTQQISSLIGNLGWEVIPTSVQSVFTLFMLLWIDWRFAAAFLFFTPLFLYVTHRSNVVVYPLREARHKEIEAAAGKLTQSIININTVKSFVQEKREVKDYQEVGEKIRSNSIREIIKLINFWIMRHSIIDIGRATTLFLSVYLVANGKITLGSLVFVLTLSEKAYYSLYRLSRFYDRVEDARIAVDRLLAIHRQKRQIRNRPNAIKPKDIRAEIAFKSLDFSYAGNKESALKDIDFVIKPGTITALVGPSGGGKTTLARMIYRHYDPSSGQVLLDGKDLRDYDIFGFRRFIAIVPQDVDVFNTTIRENIAYARPDASKAEIERAAEIANAREFIERLPKKYETIVGERGIKLSGGQRQRIGIARAVITDPRIIIFDEATSNLDSHSERLIQEAMDRVLPGRTVIIIAHRLSTVKKADQIVVLEEGHLREIGTHAELAKKKGIYAKLLKLQNLGDD